MKIFTVMRMPTSIERGSTKMRRALGQAHLASACRKGMFVAHSAPKYCIDLLVRRGIIQEAGQPKYAQLGQARLDGTFQLGSPKTPKK